MMCSRVCRGAPHSQSTLFSGKNCCRIHSPLYACPVRHWTRRPNTSRWFWSSVKCLVGFRDGGIRFAIAKVSRFVLLFKDNYWFHSRTATTVCSRRKFLPMMLKLGDVTEARRDIKIAKIQKSGACCPRFRHISTRGMALW